VPERIGKYDIVRPLGKGAMGVVYHARDSLLDRDVALHLAEVKAYQSGTVALRYEVRGR